MASDPAGHGHACSDTAIPRRRLGAMILRLLAALRRCMIQIFGAFELYGSLRRTRSQHHEFQTLACTSPSTPGATYLPVKRLITLRMSENSQCILRVDWRYSP